MYTQVLNIKSVFIEYQVRQWNLYGLCYLSLSA